MDSLIENTILSIQRLDLYGESLSGFRDVFDAVLDLYDIFETISKMHGISKQEVKSSCRRRMTMMSGIYRNGLPTESPRIDFSAIFTQWSYMYVYMLRHVHLVCHALDITADRGILTDPEACRSPTVCMIGGGPGSDVLGLSVHLRKHGRIAPLRSGVHVLDKCTEWKTSWDLLHLLLPTRYRSSIPRVDYHHFDYLEDILSSDQRQTVKEANIVTMIKSLSPVAAWLKTRQKEYKYAIGRDGRLRRNGYKWHSVYSILENMKPGAFLLYIDNRTGPQREILMDAVGCLQFDKLYDNILHGHRMPNNVFSMKALIFMQKMDYNPCTVSGTNEVILLRKKA